MEITQRVLGDLNAEITIHLEPEDYKHAVDKELKQQAKQANLPGFRVGKVPVGMVRKMVGLSVLIKEVDKTLKSSLYNYIKDNNLKLVGSPLPLGERTEDYFDVNCEKALDFSFEVGFEPDFSLNLQPEQAVELVELTVSDADIDKEIAHLLDRYGDMSEPETIEKGDIIYGRLYESNAEGEALEEGFSQIIVLNPERIENEAFFEKFEGKGADFVAELDLFGLFDTVDKIAEFTRRREEEIEGLRGKTLFFKVMKMNRILRAKLDDDFAKQALTGFGKIYEEEDPSPTVDDLRDFLRESLEEELKSISLRYNRSKLINTLIESHAFPLPENFLEKWYMVQEENEEANKQREPQDLPSFLKGLRFVLISRKLSEMFPEALKITHEELEAKAMSLYGRYLSSLPPEEQAKLIENVIHSEEFVNSVAPQIQEEKVGDWLVNNFPSVKRLSTYDEYIERIKAGA